MEFQLLLIPGAHISAVKKNHVIVVSNRFYFLLTEKQSPRDLQRDTQLLSQVSSSLCGMFSYLNRQSHYLKYHEKNYSVVF